ncbi:MAG TPA: sialidase family protein, partial [Chthoniobacterales bacterium]|nr:sialidase family protein [Chthoniobacterales bacterium]
MVSKTSFFICLALLSVIPIASGQIRLHQPFPNEGLEKYDNPPAFFWRTGRSPGMVSRYDTFTSYQVNVDSNGHNITGDAANEPSICVDPTNPNKMTIGWRQFNTVSDNFRQAGWGYTTNGGTSWTFPGVLENNVFRSDPVLNSDDTGRFFYLSLLQSFFDNMWRSLNGGQSWTNIAPADGGDKQWFTIDNTNSTGHGFQYQDWSTAGNNWGGRQFTRSTDGGATWLNPINIPNSPIWGTLDVDSIGNLFLGGESNTFWCIRSTNAKNGGVTPSFDQTTAVNLGGDLDFGDLINPAGLAGQLFLAVDRSGTATNNNVYMLASVQPTGFNSGTDVMFVRSTDGGQTFSAPLRINDDPINHNKWHWFGTLSVAPNGRIDSVWL